MRPYDSVGRYGGGEFLIVVSQTDESTVLGIAERIRKAIDSRVIVWSDGNIPLTASFGVTASAGSQPIQPQLLLRSADEPPVPLQEQWETSL